ncbi:hypothetical protein MTR67_037792 [Solanum verrucosum]|uniref:Uncharacterized protein n=1 Tax=Solanum verrucosum TaxID=315347 RepID=A0AAF0UE89_SOLVR|nr:hypothetical protein MTR67_037792 [Solanum verrucosum]
MWTISSASGGKDLFYVALIWSLISFCIAKTSSTKQIGQEMDEELQEVKKSLIFPSVPQYGLNPPYRSLLNILQFVMKDDEKIPCTYVLQCCLTKSGKVLCLAQKFKNLKKLLSGVSSKLQDIS